MDRIDLSLLRDDAAGRRSDPLDREILNLASYDGDESSLTLEEVRAQEGGNNPLIGIAKDNFPKGAGWWLYNTIKDYMAIKGFTATDSADNGARKELLLHGVSGVVAKKDVVVLESAFRGHKENPGVRLDTAGKGNVNEGEIDASLPSFKESVNGSIASFLENTSDMELAIAALSNLDGAVVEKAKESIVNMVTADISKLSDLVDALKKAPSSRVRQIILQTIGSIGADDAVVELDRAFGGDAASEGRVMALQIHDEVLENALKKATSSNEDDASEARETILATLADAPEKAVLLYNAFKTSVGKRDREIFRELISSSGVEAVITELAYSESLTSADKGQAIKAMLDIFSVSPKATIEKMAEQGADGVKALAHIAGTVAVTDYPGISRKKFYNDVVDVFEQKLGISDTVEMRMACAEMLGYVPNQKAVEILLGLLSTEVSPQVLVKAVHSTVRSFRNREWTSAEDMGVERDRIIEVLARRLSEKGVERKFREIEGGEGSFVAGYDNYTEKNGSALRMLIAGAIRSLIDFQIKDRPDTVGLLTEGLSNDSSDEVRKDIALSEGEIGNAQALGDWLGEEANRLYGRSGELTARVVESLGNSASPEAAKYLMTVINNDIRIDPEDKGKVREAAIRALGRFSGPDVEKILVDIMSSEDSPQNERIAAAESLATAATSVDTIEALKSTAMKRTSSVLSTATPTFENIASVLPYQGTTLKQLKDALGLSVYEAVLVVEDIFRKLSGIADVAKIFDSLGLSKDTMGLYRHLNADAKVDRLIAVLGSEKKGHEFLNGLSRGESPAGLANRLDLGEPTVKALEDMDRGGFASGLLGELARMNDLDAFVMTLKEGGRIEDIISRFGSGGAALRLYDSLNVDGALDTFFVSLFEAGNAVRMFKELRQGKDINGLFTRYGLNDDIVKAYEELNRGGLAEEFFQEFARIANYSDIFAELDTSINEGFLAKAEGLSERGRVLFDALNAGGNVMLLLRSIDSENKGPAFMEGLRSGRTVAEVLKDINVEWHTRELFDEMNRAGKMDELFTDISLIGDIDAFAGAVRDGAAIRMLISKAYDPEKALSDYRRLNIDGEADDFLRGLARQGVMLQLLRDIRGGMSVEESIDRSKAGTGIRKLYESLNAKGRLTRLFTQIAAEGKGGELFDSYDRMLKGRDELSDFLKKALSDTKVGEPVVQALRKLMAGLTAEWSGLMSYLDLREKEYLDIKAVLESYNARNPWDYNGFVDVMNKKGLFNERIFGNGLLIEWQRKGQSLSLIDRNTILSFDPKAVIDLPREKWAGTGLYKFLVQRNWDKDFVWELISEQVWEAGKDRLIAGLKDSIEAKKAECDRINDDLNKCSDRAAQLRWPGLTLSAEQIAEQKARLGNVKCVDPEFGRNGEPGQCEKKVINEDTGESEVVKRTGSYECVVDNVLGKKENGYICASYTCPDIESRDRNCRDELAALRAPLDYNMKDGAQRSQLKEETYPRVREFIEMVAAERDEKASRLGFLKYVDERLKDIAMLRGMAAEGRWDPKEVNDFLADVRGWSNEQLQELRAVDPFNDRGSYRTGLYKVFNPGISVGDYSYDRIKGEDAAVEGFFALLTEPELDDIEKGLMNKAFAEVVAPTIIDQTTGRVKKEARSGLEDVLSLFSMNETVPFYKEVRGKLGFKRSEEELIMERIQESLDNGDIPLLKILFDLKRASNGRKDLAYVYEKALKDKGERYVADIARQLGLKKNKEGGYEEPLWKRWFDPSPERKTISVAGKLLEQDDSRLVSALARDGNIAGGLAENARRDEINSLGMKAERALKAVELSTALRMDVAAKISGDRFSVEDLIPDVRPIVDLIGQDGAVNRFVKDLDKGNAVPEEDAADIVIIGAIGGKEARKALHRIITSDSDKKKVAVAVKMLGRMNDPAALQQLVYYYNSPSLPLETRIPVWGEFAKRMENIGILKMAIQDAIMGDGRGTSSIEEAAARLGGMEGNNITDVLRKYYDTASENQSQSVSSKKAMLRLAQTPLKALPLGIKLRAAEAFNRLLDEARRGNEDAIFAMGFVYTESSYDALKQMAGAAEHDSPVFASYEHVRAEMLKKDVSDRKGLDKMVATVNSRYSDKKEAAYAFDTIRGAYENAKSRKEREAAWNAIEGILSNNDPEKDYARVWAVDFLRNGLDVKSPDRKRLELLARLVIKDDGSKSCLNAKEALKIYYAKSGTVLSVKGTDRSLGIEASTLVPAPATQEVKRGILNGVAALEGSAEHLLGLLASSDDPQVRDEAANMVMSIAGAKVSDDAKMELDGLDLMRKEPTGDVVAVLQKVVDGLSKEEIVKRLASAGGDFVSAAIRAGSEIAARVERIKAAGRSPDIVNIRELVDAAAMSDDNLYAVEARKHLLDIAVNGNISRSVREIVIDHLGKSPFRGSVQALDVIANWPRDPLSKKAGAILMKIAAGRNYSAEIRRDAIAAIGNSPLDGTAELLDSVSHSKGDPIASDAAAVMLDILGRKGLEISIRRRVLKLLMNRPVATTVETVHKVAKTFEDDLSKDARNALLDLVSRRNVPFSYRSRAIALLKDDPVDRALDVLRLVASSDGDILRGEAGDAIRTILANNSNGSDCRISMSECIHDPNEPRIKNLSSMAHTNDDPMHDDAEEALISIAGNEGLDVGLRTLAVESLRGLVCNTRMKEGLQRLLIGPNCSFCMAVKDVMEFNRC